MERQRVRQAIETLGRQFPLYDWTYRTVPGTGGSEVGFEWYGSEDEEVMVCAHVGRSLHEKFHRHGFFFLNYAYSGDYQALSHERDRLVTISEGQMYVGQPFSGYALRGNAEKDIVILGVLVRTETFYRDFLPLISSDSRLLEFFLEPRNNLFSEEFRQATMPEDSGVRELLEMMAVEYAEHRPDAQLVLKPLALALVTKVAREWRQANQLAEYKTAVQKVVEAIARDPASASLANLAQELGYHPNYLSTLIRKETGDSFSQLVLDQRMGRARLLVEKTSLSVEEIARLCGYSSTSNFYKAYSRRFGRSPRHE